MKYVKKIPTTDKKLSQELQKHGWKKINEPTNLAIATICSMPFAFSLGGIVIFIAYLLNPLLFDFIKNQSFSFTINFDAFSLAYIVIILVFMMIHELIHAMFVPNFIKSDKTFIGINGIFGFVFTTEPIKKGRFIIISIMPCVLLSFVFLLILNFFGLLNGYTVFLCILNAIGSCVDFLNVFLVALQVPNGNTIINNGFETYYKHVK